MSLKDDPLIQDIKHRIEEEMNIISKALGNGAAGSYDEYKKLCGKILGLKHAIGLIDDAIKKYAYDD